MTKNKATYTTLPDAIRHLDTRWKEHQESATVLYVNMAELIKQLVERINVLESEKKPKKRAKP